MIYLEKIEINEETVKYYYYPWTGAKKGIVVYFRKTGLCRTDALCEGEAEDFLMYRRHAFTQIMKYCETNKFPERDMVAWG